MEATIRKTKLKEIKKQTPCAIKDIYYNNTQKTMKVFEIPLEYLIFNQYNGRIATFVKTYEKQNNFIDSTTEEGEALLSKFLWESKENRNKITQEDLHEKGQLEYGIVTADGVVIDGNRRFMLLKKNKEKYSDATAYFKAIILEDTLESNQKEIMRLETTYQMGVDDKVDYNPIQKYLKCRDLKEQNFSEGEIAKMMGEKPAKVKEYLLILELMDEYLKEFNYEGMYLVLETEKLEGHFVDLNNYLSRYRGTQGGIGSMNWTPKSDDIDDLQKIYFDYMRAGYGVHDIRVIANTSPNNPSIFTKQEMWENFSNNHFNVIEENYDEQPLEEMREENPAVDLTDLISARDSAFQNNLKQQMDDNLAQPVRELGDLKDADKPLRLLRRAKKTLEQVNTDIPAFGTQEVRDLVEEIQSKARELMEAAEE